MLRRKAGAETGLVGLQTLSAVEELLCATAADDFADDFSSPALHIVG